MAPRPPDPRSLAGMLRAWALAYPDATEDFPWGERALKVRGKAFLFLAGDGNTVSFSVKLPHSAAEALEESYVEPTHYGLGKHGWVTAKVDAGREAPLELFRKWLDESFRAVAPKAVISALDAGTPPATSGGAPATKRAKAAPKTTATRAAKKRGRTPPKKR